VGTGGGHKPHPHRDEWPGAAGTEGNDEPKLGMLYASQHLNALTVFLQSQTESWAPRSTCCRGARLPAELAAAELAAMLSPFPRLIGACLFVYQALTKCRVHVGPSCVLVGGDAQNTGIKSLRFACHSCQARWRKGA